MDKPAFSETVPNELRELGYVPPIIKSYDKNGINVWLDSRKKIHNDQLTKNHNYPCSRLHHN